MSNRRKDGKPASVFGFAAPLFPFSFRKRFPQDGIETQTAGQRNLHGEQRFENRLIVVSAVGHQRNLEGNPGLDFLESLDGDLEPGTKLGFGAVFLGSVKGYPKRQSDWNSKHFDDHGQDYPIVSPDVAGTGSAGVIPKRAGAVDMFAPFGAQRIVDSDQKFLQLKGLEDQKQKGFEKSLAPELEMGEETVEAGFVAFETRSVPEAADMPLAGLNQPWDSGRTKIRPAPFGKSQTKTEENLGKFRCRVVSNHSPCCGCGDLDTHPLASENGLFFLDPLSRFNL